MKLLTWAAAITLAVSCKAGHGQGLAYLQGLLDATPAGGWVQANTNAWSSSWATGSVGLPANGLSFTPNIVYAWSSVAWDSTRGNLLLWGGGHASYMGNEMYVWQGSDGTWTRGSLPSRMELPANATDSRTRFTVDDAAPQSAHTYEGNLYLPVNDMFMTVGGPTYNDAGMFRVRDANGNIINAGPWMWDPRKADANKVGGTTGSGYDPSTVGGNMWTNMGGQWANYTGQGLNNFIENSTAYRNENGKDVVYVTVKNGAWPSLFRYTPGDIRSGNPVNTWELVGVPSFTAASRDSSGTIDNLHNLYINTAYHSSTIALYDLNVWDLSRAGPGNADIPVNLVMRDGTDFSVNTSFAMQYDPVDGNLWLWDGSDRGTLYRTKATYNANGTLAGQWIVDKITSTTAAQPNGAFRFGVHGKWQYVDALDAFVALDEYNPSTGDSGVWFYKPLTAAVPELPTMMMWMAGLVVLAAQRTRMRRIGH